MRLSWNEVRSRATSFATNWKDAHYEKGETQTFYNDFFNIFGVHRRRVASFEEPVKLLNNKRGFIDLFWKGVLLVEQKSAGRDLVKAKEQAFKYFPGLKDNELPRYILLSDFQSFELYDLDEDTEVKFLLSELPQYVEDFGFILGVQKRTFKDQDPVNIKASELVGRLYDALKDSGYDDHDLERFLVRLVFCLFADDTGIFEPRDIFFNLISERTKEDGSDIGQWIITLFETLNKPEDKRQKSLDEDLRQFPYVNGDLFKERISIPAFDSKMRELLLEACRFSWDAISPAIFGCLFQSVMSKDERRSQGAHYTTEKNILKVIKPLFLDELKDEFETLKARRDTGRNNALKAFQQKLGNLRFFDPACGCGNFLIIAYRELRNLEIEVLQEIYPNDPQVVRQLVTDVTQLSLIDVDQFYGIEIGEFPARIAEVALFMMDHLMNNRLSLAFGHYFIRIPLSKAPHIKHADALEQDWTEVLEPRDCSYILGNPPFIGSKYQTLAQREQVRKIAQLGGSGGTLDYVTAWFIKAGNYISQGIASIGFVATNSITQGEQVAQLWPLLFDQYKLEITFAHRTFAWGSDAKGKAHVHVVIIGLTRSDQEPSTKRLFSYSDINGDPVESTHKTLTPYLFDGSTINNRHLVVKEISQPLCDIPKLIIGSKPIDGGNYIFDTEQKTIFLEKEPIAADYLHPYVGSQEYINGEERWILVLDNVPNSILRKMPTVIKRIEAVKKFRQESKSKPTQELALTPTRYHVTVIPDNPFLVVPEVSSERREYVPIGWLKPPTIPSNKLRVMLNANLWHFGILTSAMHMAWLRHIGGRLESRYQYGIGTVYNTFPWPKASEKEKDKICQLAQKILDARDKYSGETLADLYDPNLMKADLRKAHQNLDQAVDKLYGGSTFKSDRDRVEHLFKLYEQLISPLLATSTQQKKGRGTKKKLQ